MSDTICAISTPFGVGGLAVIRVSGEQACSLVAKFLRPVGNACCSESDERSELRITNYELREQDSKHKSQIVNSKSVNSKFLWEERKAMFCGFWDNDRLIDEVVVTYFKAPKSYTGEDIVEISCHGSSYVQQKILQLLIANGCCLAGAGEFTLRAFLNGKMDLSQAEAVADLIHAQSEGSHRLAIEQLRGGFSKKIKQLRSELIDFSALLELELDFSEEDVEFADRKKLLELLQKIKSEIQLLSDSFKMGNALKNGIPVAIIGKPNVGKSTLLNALLNDEKAIVSEIPGTTRDTIEDTLNIQGTLFRFIDTAGLRESSDTIENIGIERTKKTIEKAQIVIVVHDCRGVCNTPPQTFTTIASKGVCNTPLPDTSDYGDLQGKHVINVINKIDQITNITATGDEILISAKNEIGIEKLVEKLLDFAGEQRVSDRTLVSNLRHYEALNRALEFITNSEKSLKEGISTDLVAIDIRSSLFCLSEVTGEISTEDILGSVFSRFCIGK
ncbi:MAG: tRNA uridine-5-carboxymethylaminomethyl(34) synthesis GTPase MnmE [Bacteroidales bacterium]|nr:tRNA uridine-5-carboxymethylaminomethyl(34) synthesis GTPase MnmE [Bacteroidales bacterium]